MGYDVNLPLLKTGGGHLGGGDVLLHHGANIF